MANVRSLNKDKYSIDKFRFRELYYFCLQYNGWKDDLKYNENPLKGVQYDGMPGSGSPGNPTMKAAIECAEMSKKCAVIEAAAKMADPELFDYIIFAVTHENITFNYLKLQKEIPCERDRYYNSRRKFYFHLDKLLK